MVRRRIPIAQPAVGDDEWEALRAPIRDGWLTQGPRVAEFERAFAARHGVDHALAVTSGTTALQLAMAALGVGPGDEVIVPSFTWVATANSVVHSGARPVLVDVDPDTFNLSPAAVATAITPATRAVLAVHQFGLCADMDAIAAAAPGLWVIEDAACAAGASYRGRHAGSIGVCGTFSFHPRKTITTGEGGMITTRDAALAARISSLRNHGTGGPAAAPYLLPDFDVAGFNYRMTDLQAAVGLIQLAKLDRFLDERAQLAARYRRELAGVSWLRTPTEPPDGRHGWQSFVCMIDPASAPMTRDEVMRALFERGVDTRPGTHAIHMLGHYRRLLEHAPDDLPGAHVADRWSLALPLHNRMTDDDAAFVIDAVRAL